MARKVTVEIENSSKTPRVAVTFHSYLTRGDSQVSGKSSKIFAGSILDYIGANTSESLIILFSGIPCWITESIVTIFIHMSQV